MCVCGVCVCVYMCAGVWVYVHVCLCVCVCLACITPPLMRYSGVQTEWKEGRCVCVCVCVRVCVCVCVCLSVCVHACVCEYTRPMSTCMPLYYGAGPRWDNTQPHPHQSSHLLIHHLIIYITLQQCRCYVPYLLTVFCNHMHMCHVWNWSKHTVYKIWLCASSVCPGYILVVSHSMLSQPLNLQTLLCEISQNNKQKPFPSNVVILHNGVCMCVCIRACVTSVYMYACMSLCVNSYILHAFSSINTYDCIVPFARLVVHVISSMNSAIIVRI